MQRLMVVIHGLGGGGSERVLLNILKGLDKKEFFITLVMYERAFVFDAPQHVEIEILDIQSSKNLFKFTANFFLKVIRLANLMKKKKPSIIFSFLSSTNVTVILSKILSRIKCRLMVSEHIPPSIALTQGLYNYVVKCLMRYLYPCSNRIIAVSEGIKRDLVENFGADEKNVCVIYNPFDLDEIERLSREEEIPPFFQDNKPAVVAVGRLSPEKNHTLLLRSFCEVRKSNDLKLMFIGEGEEKERLIELSKKLKIDKEVFFIGFQKNPYKYMSKATMLVLPSLYEGFGNVIVEAMALGLPVIATDCPYGPSEIIEDGKDGFLVPSDDPVALAIKIKEILQDHELRANISKAAKIKAQRFKLNNIIGQYRRMLLEDTASSL